MDFSKMLQQAQEMQKKMTEAKDSLKNITTEAERRGWGGEGGYEWNITK